MEITDTSYIITFVSENGFYNTVIFDPGTDVNGTILDKFIADYKKQYPNYIKQTHRMAKNARKYKPHEKASSFDDLYEVSK